MCEIEWDWTTAVLTKHANNSLLINFNWFYCNALKMWVCEKLANPQNKKMQFEEFQKDLVDK